MKPNFIKDRNISEKSFFKFFNTIKEKINVHWHDFYEFDIVFSGSGETVINGKKYPVKRGMIAFLSPVDFNGYDVSEPVGIMNIRFKEKDISCELLNKYISLKNKIIFADEKTLEKFEILSALLGDIEENTNFDEYNRKLIECMIICYLNCCKQEEKSEPIPNSMQRAIIYINTHFAENPSMKYLADMFYLNPSYFSRTFKKNMGISYKEYIRKLKLEYSRKLIKYTDLSILEIALKSGYDSQSHFNREFRKFYNETPTDLRKKHRRS